MSRDHYKNIPKTRDVVVHPDGSVEPLSKSRNSLGLLNAGRVFVYRPGGIDNLNVYTDFKVMSAHMATVPGYKLLQLDDTFESITFPAGSFDMTDTEWTAFPKRGNSYTFVNISDGTVFPNLTMFKGNFAVTYTGSVGPSPVTNLPIGSIITLSDGCVVRSTGSIPFFDVSSVTSGSMQFRIFNTGQLGDGSNAAFKWAVGNTVVFKMDPGGTLRTNSLSAPASASLQVVGGTVQSVQSNFSGDLTYFSPDRLSGEEPLTSVKVSVFTAKVNQTSRCNPTSAGFVVNLPAVTKFNTGDLIEIKNVSGSTNQITVTPNGANTIDGAATLPMTTARQHVRLRFDGVSDWLIV